MKKIKKVASCFLSAITVGNTVIPSFNNAFFNFSSVSAKRNIEDCPIPAPWDIEKVLKIVESLYISTNSSSEPEGCTSNEKFFKAYIQQIQQSPYYNENKQLNELFYEYSKEVSKTTKIKLSKLVENINFRKYATQIWGYTTKNDIKDVILVYRLAENSFNKAETIVTIFEHPSYVLVPAGLLLFSPLKNLVSTSYNSLKNTAIYAYNTLIYNRLKIESDPAKMLALLNEGLNKTIIGQEEAIDTITNEIVGWLQTKKMSNTNGSCLMTLLGASGIGKTYTSREISKIVFGKDMQSWQFITSSAIKADKSLSAEVPADQVFNTKSELVRQLEKNPEVVIVIDEIDKMYANDKNQTVLERLRDAKDSGKLLVRTDKGNYKFIDVSRTIFILTSNERAECWGLPARELTPAYAKSRTTVDRNASLTNRFKVIEFKELQAPSFVTILTPVIDNFIQNIYDNYDITVEKGESLINDLAEACVDRNKGVRGANDFIISLNGTFVKFLSSIGNEEEAPRKVTLNYNKEKDQFLISSSK